MKSTFENTKDNINISILLKSKNISKSNKKNTIFASIFVIFVIVLIIFMPSLCINSVFNGLLVWVKCVVPSLLPFMFFTKILTDLNVISTLTNKLAKVSSKFFNAPKISSYIFLMSIISGYPVGAKLISEYKKMGIITSKHANKLCTFCSTSGPLFIVGSVGTSMMFSSKIGYVILASHILSSIINGIVFRNLFVDKTEITFENSTNVSQNILGNSMKESILSVLVVGGFIAIAFLVIDLFDALGLFLPMLNLLEKVGISKEISSGILSGILEVSKGCLIISGTNISMLAKACIASFLIGFGGICVFFQAATFLKDAGVNTKFYIAQKTSHGIISAILTFLICKLFGI